MSRKKTLDDYLKDSVTKIPFDEQCEFYIGILVEEIGKCEDEVESIQHSRAHIKKTFYKGDPVVDKVLQKMGDQYRAQKQTLEECLKMLTARLEELNRIQITL